MSLFARETFWFWSTVALILTSIIISVVYSVFDILFIIGFIALIIVPGYFISWMIPESELSLLDRLIVSIPLGVSLICAFGLAFTALGIGINFSSVLVTYLLIDGIFLALMVRRIRRSNLILHNLSGWDMSSFLLLLIWAGAVCVRSFPLRTLLVAPYLDPALHGMFVALIVQKGAIPSTLAPYANAPFTYPPGLHLNVAFLTLLTGLPIGRILLLITNLFNGTIALTVYLFCERIGNSKTVGILAASFIAFVSPYPLNLLFLGKESMVTGLLLLPVAVVLTYRSLNFSPRDPRERFSYLFTATLAFFGLIVAYYTTALLYLMFVVPFVLIEVLCNLRKGNYKISKRYIIGLLTILAFGITFSLLLTTRFFLAENSANAISFHRDFLYNPDSTVWITSSPITSLSNLGFLIRGTYGDIITGSSILGVVASLITRNGRRNWSIAAWLLVQLVFYTPYPSMLNPVFYQITVSIMQICIFLPLVFFSAFFFSSLLDRLGEIQRASPSTQEKLKEWRPTFGITSRSRSLAAAFARILLIVMLVLLASYGAYASAVSYAGANGGALVHTLADYEALLWIRDNTPTNAIFLNNAMVLWSHGIIIGTDAGSWIPAISHRRVLFPVQDIGDIWPQQALEKYSILEAAIINPNNATNLALMRQFGIDYVYIGPIIFNGKTALDPALFSLSKNFRLVWHEDEVWIFHLSD